MIEIPVGLFVTMLIALGCSAVWMHILSDHLPVDSDKFPLTRPGREEDPDYVPPVCFRGGRHD